MPSGKLVEIPSSLYGKYLVRSRLGAGGMAEVFLAEVVHRNGQQLNVALKLMREGVSAEAFADEADLMGMLSHPNLVRRLEVGEAFGRPFIAMEFLVGGDLRSLMDAHSRQLLDFPAAIGVHVLLEVLKGLSYFHQAKTRTGMAMGLVHGDVNPSNIFFSGLGEVKLGDFGVAKSKSANIGPVDGITAGKLHYLSPEQTRGELLGPASDLFSVGIILHELVVGFHPFREKDERDVKKVMASIRSAKLKLPDYVDKPMTQILKKALHPDEGSRYKTAGQFAGDLLAYELDHDSEVHTQKDVQDWLEGVLGLRV
ncbi:MAG: serine/threonine protein kinase [Myxococcaceae bacterium]